MAHFISFFSRHRKEIILGSFLIFNFVISALTRGGITMLGNVAYGASLLSIMLLAIWDFNKRKKEEVSRERIIALLFMTSFLLSFIYSLNKGYGLSELILFSSGIVIFFYLSSTDSLTQKQLDYLLKLILAAGLFFVISGIFIYLSYPFDRLSSFFYNFEDQYIGYPNALADLLLICMPLGAYYFFNVTRKKSVYYMALLILFLIAFYLTYSRGAYLSLIFTAFVGSIFFSRSISQKLPYKKILLSLVAIIIFTWGLNELRNNYYPVVNVAEKITLNADEKASSVNERLEFYQGSWQIIKDYPWTGVGSDGFQFIYPQYQEYPFTTSNHPHNLFLKIATENGVITALLLLVFFIFILARSILSKSPLQIVIGLSILGLLLHNQIDYNLNFVPNILLLFFLSGLIINQQKRISSSYPIINGFLTLLALLIVTLSINEGYYNYHFQQGRKQLDAGNYSQAVSSLEKAKKLIFPRRLYTALGEAYLQDGKLNEGIENYQTAAKTNILDAHAYNALGELFAQMGLTDFARENFQLTVYYDRQNFLRFHYNVLSMIENIPDPAQEQYLQILKDFVPVLASNQHNIILTDNPQYAIKIAELLAEKTQAPEFTELKTQLQKLKEQEERKFTEKFHFQFKPL